VGTLTTRHRDDGAGRTRLYLDLLPHEVERLLSAELSYGVYGFREGRPLRVRNPRDKREKAVVVERAERLVSFLDTVGHEPWLRTTIRGIVGQRLDYGLLVVAADDGVTHITREHLGVLLAMELPVLIVVTKADRATPARRAEVLQEVSDLLGRIGRAARPVARLEEMEDLLREPGRMRTVFPVLQASAVTLEGYDLLDALFGALPPRAAPGGGPFELYVDKVYSVAGVGAVLSGTVKQGTVRSGEVLRLGPREDGSFAEVRAQSIEVHYFRVDRARAGDVVGIAVRGVRPSEVRRGMLLASEPPRPAREFEADVTILNHPTRIKRGYEPVVHLETVCESARFTWMERPYMMAGQRGRARLAFKFRPYAVAPGQRFLFREGKSKGIGKVVRVVN
jgi:elongation factor 1-alpha